VRGRFSWWVAPQPSPIVLFNLLDMMRNVAFLSLDPFFQADLALLRVLEGVQPDHLWQRDDQTVCHAAQPPNDFQCLSSALVQVAERSRPFLRVKVSDSDPRLRNQVAATYVGRCLAIGQVKDNLVNAPTISGRLVEPHFFWKVAQNS